MEKKCIFCRVITRELPGEILFEDDNFLAFRDINPVAPFHVLLIPKEHKSDLKQYSNEDQELLGNLLLIAKKIADDNNIDSFRTVINTGVEAGQTVSHLHLHIIGGRYLEWHH
jgi:histidine triad (HIT) family protein